MSDDLEKLTEEIMELRMDINILSNAMLEKKRVCLSGAGATISDLRIIQNARETIQRLAEKEEQCQTI